MTYVPGLELVAPRKVPPDDFEVVDGRSPLTIITWAAAVILAGIATIATMLLLGPIFGTVAILAVMLSIVRRYERAEGEPDTS